MDQNEIRSIVIFRALKLGDMLCSVPALRSVRKKYPQASITLISSPQMNFFAKRFYNYIDEFIPFCGFPGLPEVPFDPERFIPFVQNLQKRNFDLAIQMQGTGALTNPLISLFNAKKMSGLYHQGSFCPNPATFVPFNPDKHEIHRCLLALEGAGIVEEDDQLEFPIYEKDFQRLKEYGLHFKEEYVCIHPGASCESKRWDRSYFASLADLLIKNGFKVVFTGSSFESSLVGEIREKMKFQSIDSASLDLDLGALGALVKRSKGIICNDTGVSHLATALGTPSLVIFLETDPKRWAPIDSKKHRSFFRPDFSKVVSEAVDLFM